MALPNKFIQSRIAASNQVEAHNRNLSQSEQDRNRYNNARRIAQENRKKVIAGTIQEISVLNSEVLLAAPAHFFDKVQEVAMRLTTIIQNNLSNSDKAALIAQLKNNPTDVSLREDAFRAINTEYLKYDSETMDMDYKSLDELERIFVLAMTFNEICGLGPLEPLYRDTRIKEIMCNGPFDINVELDGLYTVDSCKFVSADHLQELINKLYASVNREITRSNPRDNARLKDKSRLFATHRAIAPDGPNLNIRRHPNFWISPMNLLEWESVSPELLEWIGKHINAGCSFIVNGGTGSGKTTTLSCLLGFYPNNKRIVTIEKNLELKVPPWKLQAAALECIPKKNDSSVYVDMRDLVECCTQMRPDLIVCGEIIGPEAYDAVQAGNTGHQLATTVHSNSSEKCIERVVSLTSQAGLIQGKETLELIAAAIDIIITVERLSDGSRKIINVSEVGTEAASGVNGAYLPVRTLWEYRPNRISQDLHTKITGEWVQVQEMSQDRRDMHRLDNRELLDLNQLLQLATDPTEQTA